MKTGMVLLALAAGIGAPCHDAAAQTDSRLVAIVRLAQDGMADSARGELQKLLTGLTPADSLYAEALYTQALVAVTDVERRLVLRKVMVEHSSSSWADDAILLLGQLEYANGNARATVNQIRKLMDDYPLSPLRATAGFWGARAAGDLGDGALACQWAEAGLAAASDDVELKNQLQYQQQRCRGIAAHNADTTHPASADTANPAPPPPPLPPPPPPERVTGIFVQVAAVDTEAGAEAQASRVKRLNFDAVVVHEGGYYKVRAGPFTNRADANAALARLRSVLGVQPFIVVVR